MSVNLVSSSSSFMESNERFLKTIADADARAASVAEKILVPGIQFVSCNKEAGAQYIFEGIPSIKREQLRIGFALCRKLPQGESPEILAQVGKHLREFKKTLSLFVKLSKGGPFRDVHKADLYTLFYCMAQAYISRGEIENGKLVLDNIFSHLSDPKEKKMNLHFWNLAIALLATIVPTSQALLDEQALFMSSPTMKLKFWIDLGSEFQILEKNPYAAICYEKALKEDSICSEKDPTVQSVISPVVMRVINQFLVSFRLDEEKKGEVDKVLSLENKRLPISDAEGTCSN